MEARTIRRDAPSTQQSFRGFFSSRLQILPGEES